MSKQKYFIIFTILFLGLGLSIFQYVKTFQIEVASAVTPGTPNPGHTWSSMECSAGSLCIDTANGRLGVGTNVPTNKLDVVGNVGVTGTITAVGNISALRIIASDDVCNGSGACLSQLNSFVGSQNLVLSAHTFNMCTTTPDNSGFGELVNVGTAQNAVWICKFDKNTCPTALNGQPAWNQYYNYSTTQANTGSYGGSYCYCACNNGPCTTASHIFANTPIESCGGSGYAGDGLPWNCSAPAYYYTWNVSATITQIGCY